MRAKYYSDLASADEYYKEIVDECGAYNADNECWNRGNRFSKIYALAGITMMLFACNSVLMLLGTWFVHARLCGGVCGCFCSCLNVASIITTAVFRFSSWGKLSTLCDGPSKFDNGINPLSDDRTVSGDAALIIGLWVAQMIFCVTNCCHCLAAGKKDD